jgi:NOL1/NOP2/fmu family ribosome biogenesis protein
MKKLKILNKKEIKEILKPIKEQWGADINLDYAFLQNSDNDIFIANKEIFDVDFERLNVNSLGLYFGELKNSSLRLSIEGSQIIGPKAKKNVIELDDGETKLWLRGYDLEKNTKAQGYVLVKHNNDFMGSGRVKDQKILNFVPKNRRIRSAD